MEISVQTKTGHIAVFLEKPYIDEAKCKRCGKPIFWARNQYGKMITVSIVRNGHLYDYIAHFEECPKQKKVVKKNNYEDNKNIF